MGATGDTIEQIDQDIAEAERLMHEKVQSIIAALRRGADTVESEKRVREMRAALELLYVQRRRVVRAGHDPSSATAA